MQRPFLTTLSHTAPTYDHTLSHHTLSHHPLTQHSLTTFPSRCFPYITSSTHHLLTLFYFLTTSLPIPLQVLLVKSSTKPPVQPSPTPWKASFTSTKSLVPTVSAELTLWRIVSWGSNHVDVMRPPLVLTIYFSLL